MSAAAATDDSSVGELLKLSANLCPLVDKRRVLQLAKDSQRDISHGTGLYDRRMIFRNGTVG